jgi:hypothetical protein
MWSVDGLQNAGTNYSFMLAWATDAAVGTSGFISCTCIGSVLMGTDSDRPLVSCPFLADCYHLTKLFILDLIDMRGSLSQ